MIQQRGLLTGLLTVFIAVPALAQPVGPNPEPPPNTGVMVVVTPHPPVIGQPAGPGQTPPTTPATHDWNNVSHINGQLVKVGEQGDYLYNNGRNVNLASNPIGWMFGFYGVSLSVAIHPNVAIRGDANLFRDDSTEGHEFGVSAPIYFRRVFDGPFLEPGLVTRSFNDGCDDCGGDDESTGPEVMFGWHWTFDSGLNVAMAAGAMRNMSSSSTGTNAEPVGYFRVGYAF